ncbi:MAG: hypothetical protein R2848_04710 [Thermomicrobiales bacterium]
MPPPLEAISSPPPVYNFAAIPTVTHRDQLWWDKYGDEHGHAHVPTSDTPTTAEIQARERRASACALAEPDISLLAALGLFIFAVGLLFHDYITIGLLHLPIVALLERGY